MFQAETKKLLQAEKIHKITCILLKMVQAVILSVAQLEISQVLNGTTPEIQHRKRGPYLPLKPATFRFSSRVMLSGSAEQRSAVIIIKFDSHLNANDAEANTVELTIFQFCNFVYH